MRTTRSQRSAIEYMKMYALDRGTPAYPLEFKEEPTVKDTDYGVVWLKMYLGCVGDEGTALVSCRDYWFVQIGRRGKKTAFQYPKSLEQFKGKQVFGFHVK